MATSVRCLLPEHHVIEVVIYGRFTIEDAVAVRDDAWALTATHAIHDVMLEMSGTTETPNASEIVLFAEGLATFGDPERLRVPVVRPTEVIPATWTGLFVTAMVNRGMRAAEFRNRGDALAWLAT